MREYLKQAAAHIAIIIIVLFGALVVWLAGYGAYCIGYYGLK